jgi:hypothetical protein
MLKERFVQKLIRKLSRLMERESQRLLWWAVKLVHHLFWAWISYISFNKILSWNWHLLAQYTERWPPLKGAYPEPENKMDDYVKQYYGQYLNLLKIFIVKIRITLHTLNYFRGLKFKITVSRNKLVVLLWYNIVISLK